MSSPISRLRAVGGLDGVRALAAFAVVVFHVSGRTIADADSPAARAFSRLGGAGVAVFFVLSGFLLYRPFVARSISGSRPVAWRFYWNRVVRVYPAYWLVLTITLFVLDDARTYTADQLVRMYFLVHTYDTDLAFAGVEVSWTLVVEVSFYLVLPVVALVPLGLQLIVPRLGFAGSQLVVLALVYAGAFTFRAVMFAVSNDDQTFMLWLPSNADIFALGMLLAVVETGAVGGPSSSLRRLAAGLWICWILAAAAYVALVMLDIPRAFSGERPSVTDLMARKTLEGLLGFFVLLPLALRPASQPPHAGVRALEFSPLAWLGVVSYGVYLWHIAALDFVAELTDDGRFARLFLPVLSVVSVLSLVIAAVSYYSLERPALQLKVPSMRRARPPDRWG